MSNLSEIILNEVALEGLDGITLKGLWQRIKTHPNVFFESSKIFNLCWDFIKSQHSFGFYELPKPRGDLLILENRDPIDLKTDEEYVTHYKLNIIEKDGILGSCQDYETRKEVKRDKLLKLSYETVMERYGNRLVIVADQKSRRNALVPSHLHIPAGSLSTIDYAILERVGRSRTVGERATGKYSLIEFVSDTRSMFFRRETLRKLGVITIEKTIVQGCSTLVLYLPQFRPTVAEPSMALLRLIQEAEEDPEGLLDTKRAVNLYRTVMGDHTRTWHSYRKCSEFSKRFEVVRVKKKDSNNYISMWKLKPEIKKEDEICEEKQEFLNDEGQYYGVSVEKQILLTVEADGIEGSTMPSISDRLGIPKPVVRNAVKASVKNGSFLVEKRQIKSACTTFYISSALKEEFDNAKVKLPDPKPESKGKKGTKRINEAEDPLEMSLVDIYGVTTTITVERVHQFTTGIKMDIDSRIRRGQAIREIILNAGVAHNVMALTNKLSLIEGSAVCRKTTLRLLQNLVDEGVVSAYKATYKRNKETKVTQIFCDRSKYNMKHERFLDTLNLLHKKMVPVVKMKAENVPKKVLDKTLRFRDVRSFNFPVLKTFHKFLMHITRFWIKEQKAVYRVPDEWLKYLDEGESLVPIYDDVLSWMTFIPPRKPAVGEAPGWISMNCILEMLPAKLVQELYNPIEKSPNMPMILKHPIKKYYMMSQCPTIALTENKWSIDAIRMNLHKLCLLGLLRFSEDGEIYMNSKTTLVDTITTEYVKVLPDGMKKIEFVMDSPQMVNHYWDEITRICLNTLLPRRKLLGYDGACRELAEWLRPIKKEEATILDNGTLPGDNKGAAGTHSQMTVHLYTYWDVSYKPQNIKKHYSSTIGLVAGTRIRNRAKKPKVHKQVFDQVDEYANDSQSRTKWTSAEDTCLLLCRLANLYLSTNRRDLQHISSVNYRDVLHWMCMSLDKAAKMCSRRVLFLGKNEVTKTTIEACLKEMSHTPAVTNRFGPDFLEKLREAYPCEEEFLSALKIHFVDLVHILSGMYSKFTSTAFQKRSLAILPDDVEAFESRFIFQKKEVAGELPDLEGQERIQVNTVINVIHSSMCCSKDTASYNLILLDIYKNFPENILSVAMEHARELQLITKYKINHVQSRHTIPLNTRPFHLSNVYTRKFIIDFNYDILASVWRYIEEARSGREEFTGINRSFAFLFLGLQSRDAIEVNTSLAKNVRKVNLKENLVEEEERRKEAKPRVSFKEDIDVIDFDYEPTELLLKVNPLNWHVFCYLKETINGKDKEIKKIKIKDNHCNFSCLIEKLKEFEEMEEFLSKVNVKDYKEAISAVMDDLLEEKEKMIEANKKDLGKIKGLKRWKYKFIDLLDDLSRDTFDPLCQRMTEIKLKDGVIFPSVPNKELINKKLLNWSVIYPPKKTITDLFKNNLIGNSILGFIRDSKINGVTGRELMDVFDKKDELENTLKTLLDNHWIVLCGQDELKYVHKDFIEPWTVKSYEAKSEQEKDLSVEQSRLHLRNRPDPSDVISPKRAKVIFLDDKAPTEGWKDDKSRAIVLRVYPWIRITGTINQRVVDKVMGTILLYLQGKPAATIPDLAARFPLFEKAHLILLLHLMEENNLVNLFSCKIEKSSILSTYTLPVIEPASVLLDDSNEIFIEPTTDSVLKYCEIRGENKHRENYF